MKNIIRFGFSAIALMFVFGIFAVPQARSQNIVGDILKRIDDHYKTLKSLRANIKREKYNSQLDETDKFEGKISLLPRAGRNFSFRLDWTKPSKEAISVVDGRYVLYKESNNTVYHGSSSSKNVQDKGGNVLKIFSMSKDEIKANYDVQYVGQEAIAGGVETWHLKLTPKAAASYKFAEIWVDKDGMPRMGKITLKNDDTDTALVSALEKNVKLKAEIFTINYPGNATLIAG